VYRPKVLRAVAVYTALTAIATCALFPILWAVSGSLKRAGEVTTPTLFPAQPQWSNYREVFAVMPFWRMFVNSVLYAGCVSAGQVFFCSLAGYAFARLRFRGRDTLFVLYLGTLMVPLTVTVIPQFILMRIAGLTDTPWAMIVPGLFGSAFGTYLMRQFFRTLPDELEEAAILDGCTPWQIYWRILLPHAKPAVMVLAVLTWVNVWNDFLWPLLMIQRNSISTLTLGLVRMQGEYVSRWPVLMAASILILLPLLFVYAIAQRAFIRGIAVTGLGG
jgi:multiple sugar transport system permease protein